MLTMSSLALLMITGLEAKVHSETKVEPYHKVHETKMEPYLGSYQVENSCQFVVCGPQYSREFSLNERPREGSCSGECNLLASSLVTNKFSREFLWSSCANMCNNKYSLQLFSDYKTRLSCMSSCFSLYLPLAPHHSLARYCIQASCPSQENLPQLDCFSQCSSHVTSKVAPGDWGQWASHLATECQEDSGQGRHHRLECADDLLWNNTISKVNHQEIDAISEHCRGDLCEGSLSCANICLDHLLAVARDEDRLRLWQDCSSSPSCSPRCTPPSACSAERLACADTCLEAALLRMEEARQSRERERSTSEQLAILASQAWADLSWTFVRIKNQFLTRSGLDTDSL